MYCRIYGVMSTSGFHTEVANATSLAKALELVKSLSEERYPFFAITEHDYAQAHARSITIGLTVEREPSGTFSLIEYKPNPMEHFSVAEKLFSKLKEKADDLATTTEGKD